MDTAARLRAGLVIPAHPLALAEDRTLDERRQRALTRYYLASGAGGIAVGVHTTQFAIREVGLLQPVLAMAAEEMHGRAVVKIAGVCGKTHQALQEAELAAALGYDAVLLSMGALREAPMAELLSHAQQVASIIPVIGFYLQPSVGGRVLPYAFWREFADIPNVVAIKIAPFNRYQTIDVVRAVSESNRAREIALYTGNDDSIVMDLLSSFAFGGERVSFAGGLLGHWAVWTNKAVQLLKQIKETTDRADTAIPSEMLRMAHRVTDMNAALFDPSHNFRGCIAGVHEILRRQGLLAGRWCLDRNEDLSDGQVEEIERVCRLYPELQDDQFVRQHLASWLE